MNKLQLILNSLLLVCILLIGMAIGSPRVQYVKPTEIKTNKAFLDSLVAIANRPPQIKTDTLRDTIKVPHPVIKYLKPDTVFMPGDTINPILLMKDSLVTKYFKIELSDSVSTNYWVRSWDYEVYKENYITIIEKEKPVIQYKEPEPSPYGLYGGIGYSKSFDTYHIISFEGAYLFRKNWILQVRTGLIFNNTEFEPIVGGSILKHF